ncbi:MAG: MFS transporter [Burkholderia sp.]|nr:MFS transporter [Burkholderia sp.]
MTMQPVSKRSLKALDWLNFFIANFQTGLTPFITSYLATYKWTQGEIGIVLSIGTISAMIIQLPGGAILDSIKNKKSAAACAISTIILSVLLFSLSQKTVFIIIAEIFYGFASCMLLPAISTLSFSLVGYTQLGERLSQNARWASIGSVIASGLIGLCGEYFSIRAVFWLIASLALPALVALSIIQPTYTIAPASTRIYDIFYCSDLRSEDKKNKETLLELIVDKRILTFSGCIMLFHFSNTAMLNLIAGEVTDKMSENIQLVIAACVAVPQAVVALLSTWVGYSARRWGRRPILILGFFALPVRALLFSKVSSPYFLVLIQALDGISTVVLSVMLPLVAADVTGRKGRYNLCIGLFGLSSGIGAMLSTAIAGFVAERFDISISFLGLGIIGICGTLLVWFAMPETKMKKQI